MATVTQKTIVADANGSHGAPGWIDTRGNVVVTMFVKAVGGTSVTVKPVATSNPDAHSSIAFTSADLGYTTPSFRETGDAAYTTTGVSIAAGESVTFHLDPSDLVPFVGLELASISGAVEVTATVYMA
jgi:hypothetical protein